jgi:hypothetical protein
VAAPDPSGGFEHLAAHALDEQEGSVVLWSVVGPPGARLQAVAAAAGATLVHLKGRSALGQRLEFTAAGGALQQWSRQPSTPVGTPVVADLEDDGRIEVVVQTGTEEVVCIEAPERKASAAAPQARWQLQGYGQTNNAPFHKGVSAADLDQDGIEEVLFARETAGGNASLVAVEPDGKIRWQTVFEEFDGSMPIWNFSGLSYWTAGHFTSTTWNDVFVSLRKGKIGSEIGHLLDGRSGEILWVVNGFALPGDGSRRSFGGHPAASGDTDGDLELMASTNTGVHLYDPENGAILNTLTGVAFATTDVVSGDIDADGRDEFLFASGQQIICVELEGETLQQAWTLDVGAWSSDLALADVDGDLFLDIVVCTADGYVKAYSGNGPGQTLVEEEHNQPPTPDTFALDAPFPNPFNSAVAIRYQVVADAQVQLDIFDLQGQRLRQLVHTYQVSGSYQVQWDGTSTRSDLVATGVYLVRLRAGSREEIRKVVLLK